MKRWFSLALVALFLVPVLAIGASAAEIYEFEYMERPMMYSDSFDFVYHAGSFYCPVIIPDGSYVVHFSFTSSTCDYVFLSSPVDFVFTFDPEYGCDVFTSVIPFSRNGVSSDFLCFIGRGDALDGSMFVIDFDMSSSMVSASLSLERVDSVSSESGFDSLLGDVSSFTGSCFSSITKVADTITGSPLLLLTVGILFIGGCIGISGRLFSRR